MVSVLLINTVKRNFFFSFSWRAIIGIVLILYWKGYILTELLKLYDFSLIWISLNYLVRIQFLHLLWLSVHLLMIEMWRLGKLGSWTRGLGRESSGQWWNAAVEVGGAWPGQGVYLFTWQWLQAVSWGRKVVGFWNLPSLKGTVIFCLALAFQLWSIRQSHPTKCACWDGIVS